MVKISMSFDLVNVFEQYIFVNKKNRPKFHITSLNDVGSHNITLRCWEYSPNLSTLM